VTVPARSRSRSARVVLDRPLAVLILVASIAVAAPARAQVAASVAVETDYRLRGYSISAGRPVVTGAITYDDRSGFYANLSATEVFSRDGPRFLGVEGGVGYALRIAPAVSLDAGVHRTQYRAAYPGGRTTRYTEGYIGLTAHRVTARVFYSPDYLAEGVSTLYGELDGGIEPAPNWRLNAHVGALVYLDAGDEYYVGYRPSDATRYDWRVGVSHRLGRVELHAAVSGGGPGSDYYAGRLHDRTALTAGASWSF